MRRRNQRRASDHFRRDIFVARELAESRPARVVNWVIVRRLAVTAALFWVASAVAVGLEAPQAGPWSGLCFALGLPFAIAAIAFRVLERLWIERRH